MGMDEKYSMHIGMQDEGKFKSQPTLLHQHIQNYTSTKGKGKRNTRPLSKREWWVSNNILGRN